MIVEAIFPQKQEELVQLIHTDNSKLHKCRFRLDQNTVVKQNHVYYILIHLDYTTRSL